MKLKHELITYAILLFQTIVIAVTPMTLLGKEESMLETFDLKVISMEEGLPHSFIDYIIKDSKGYMWFALAGGGLVRYDGYSFERFDPGVKDREISGHFVGCIQEDSWGRIWAGTDQGLSLIDVSTLSILPLRSLGMETKELENISVKDLTFDAKGRLWITSVDDIIVIAFNAVGQVSDMNRYSIKSGRLSSTVSRDVYQDGSVITAIGNSIVRLTYNTNAGIKSEKLDIGIEPHFILNDALRQGESLWLATDMGLYCCNTHTNELKRYVHSPIDRNSISQNFVNFLLVNNQNQLLVSTLHGLNVYSEENDNFNRIDFTQNNLNEAFSSNFLNCLFSDGDKLWVGTEGNGIMLLSPSRTPVSFYKFNKEKGKTYPINSILEDNQQTLWLGMVEGGLAYKDKNSEEYTILTTANSALPHNSVSALAIDSDDRLWIGTWGQGVVVVDRKQPHKAKFQVNLAAQTGEVHPYVGALKYDALNQGVWIGASVGLFFYDLQADTLLEPFPEAFDKIKGAIGCEIDNKKHLWLGTYEGLYEIDLTSRNAEGWAYRLLEKKLDNPTGHLDERISSVRMSSDGSLWVGSTVNGLYRRILEDGEERFVNYNIDNGLPHNSVRGILEDINGNIWASTYNGLARYDIQEDLWEHIQPSKQPVQFYWNAYENTSDGHLLFGSSDGIYDIDVRKIAKNPADFEVQFTKVIVNGQALGAECFTKTIKDKANERLSYNENERTITIEFSALDYLNDPSCYYFYKLKGFDKDWQRLPNSRHDVTYTNLPPGNYDFEVSYGHGGKNALRQASVLGIDVQPLFYNTVWFKLLLLGMVLSIAYALYKYKLANIKRQKSALEVAVEERTQELQKQKVALEERNIQVQELTVDRLSFFTNITHEFRTPITLILGPLRQARLLNDNPKVAKQLQYIGRNANYLLSLVNQLMDFRKIESGKFELARRPGNLIQFLRDAVEGFEPLAQDRKIKFEIIMRLPDEDISFDREAMRKLLHNFLSNALKYTPDEGEITLRAALLPERCAIAGDVRTLYLSVSDTGDGIDPADIDKIFNRFYQGKGNIKYPNMASSSGIGLYLCKNIVEAYGGQLKVKNKPTGGCTFRVLLPIVSEDAVEPAEDKLTLITESEPNSSLVSTALTILVVEDNMDMREYIGDVLMQHYAVIKAASAREALKILKEETINFIISDLMMPEMDGLQFVKIVKDNLAISHIPIIMLTAKSSDMTRLESYETGVDDFISKPFNPQLLLSRIDNILQNKKRYQRQFTLDYEVEKVDIGVDSRDKKFLAQVMQVVKDNYKNSYFEVGDFAEALGVSRSFLNKKLQSLIAMSASQLVKNYRLKLARELIIKNRKTKAYTIQEIAYDVGFNDSKYFTKCFSKEFNVTPSGLMSGEEQI